MTSPSKATLVRSDATRCRYESGEGYPASWPQYLRHAVSVCGHRKWMSTSKWQEQSQPRSGFGFGSRHVGWNCNVISSGRCDQLRCVAARLDRNSRRFTCIFTALQARLGIGACDTNVIAVSCQSSPPAAIPSHPSKTAQALRLPDPFEARC